MGTISLQIPQAGLPNSTEDAKVASDITTLQTWANGNVDGANVDASLTGRRLIASAPFFIPAGTVAASGPYAIAQDGTLIPNSAASTAKPLLWWYFDPAKHAVVGKSTYWAGRLQLATGVNPAATVSMQVNAVTFGGSAGGIQWVLGSSASIGSIGLTPGGGAAVVSDGGSVAFPTAGAYIPLVGVSANTAANSAVSGVFQIFALNS